MRKTRQTARVVVAIAKSVPGLMAICDVGALVRKETLEGNRFSSLDSTNWIKGDITDSRH